MNTLIRILFFFGLMLFGVAACKAKAPTTKEPPIVMIGEIPIGSVPVDESVFSSTDCGEDLSALSDCSAVGRDGIRYAFFDGSLSKVSMRKGEVDKSIDLPGGMFFGEDIESASAKIIKLGIVLDRGTTPDGRIVFSSDFVLRSTTGIYYSIELIADKSGKLMEVVQRTDF